MFSKSFSTLFESCESEKHGGSSGKVKNDTGGVCVCV